MDALKSLGLTSSEIDVYKTLLKIGPTTATNISKHSSMNRTHIYDSITKLQQKGLVSVYEQNNVKYFTASPPERLRDYLEELKTKVNNAIPDLENIHKINQSNAKVQLFIGKKGIKTVLRDVIKTRQNYTVLGEEGQFQELFPIYIKQFFRDVVQFKIKERVISKTSMKKKLVKSKNTTIKYLTDEFFSPVTTVTYGKKVAIVIWREPFFVILIDDKEVADSYKSHFELLWKIAE